MLINIVKADKLNANVEGQFSFVQKEVIPNSRTNYARVLADISNSENKDQAVLNPSTQKDSPTHKIISTDFPSKLKEDDFQKALLFQISIWLPIILVLILFFTIITLVDMPIQKNSILYAKYGTTKPSHLMN